MLAPPTVLTCKRYLYSTDLRCRIQNRTMTDPPMMALIHSLWVGTSLLHGYRIQDVDQGAMRSFPMLGSEKCTL